MDKKGDIKMVTYVRLFLLVVLLGPESKLIARMLVKLKQEIHFQRHALNTTKISRRTSSSLYRGYSVSTSTFKV
jgi:hypothetical protein